MDHETDATSSWPQNKEERAWVLSALDFLLRLLRKREINFCFCVNYHFGPCYSNWAYVLTVHMLKYGSLVFKYPHHAQHGVTQAKSHISKGLSQERKEEVNQSAPACQQELRNPAGRLPFAPYKGSNPILTNQQMPRITSLFLLTLSIKISPLEWLLGAPFCLLGWLLPDSWITE